MISYKKLTVAHTRHLKAGYVSLILTYDRSMQIPEPGQFFMLKPENRLIARPISVHNFFSFMNRGSIEFLFKIVGEGTRELSRLKKGDTLTLWGPIGNRFPIPDKKRRAILVAGGRGIAPLFYLAIKLFKRGYDTYLFYGVKRSEEIMHLLRLKNLCRRIYITSEDGKKGKKGLITTLFEEAIPEYLKNINTDLLFDEAEEKDPVCYVCGPDIMMERVCEISLANKIETYLSLEARMACGTGVCLGCSVETRGGDIYHICKDGPVFNAEEFFRR